MQAKTWGLLAAGVFSIGLHVAGFGVNATAEHVEIAGGAPVQFARLGNSFSDMSAGAVRPSVSRPAQAPPPDHTTESPPIETTLTETKPQTPPPELSTAKTSDLSQIQPSPAPPAKAQPEGNKTPVKPAQTSAAATTMQSPVARVQSNQTSESLPVSLVAASMVTAREITPSEPVETPLSSPVADPVKTMQTSTPVIKATPVTSSVSKPVSPAQATAVQPNTSPSKVTAQDVPMRPRPAPPRPKLPKQDPAKKAPVAKPASQNRPKGNGAVAAIRGQSDGRKTSKATEAARDAAGKAQAAGNAAASRYSGLVWQRLNRARRRPAGARGTATVGFSVSANGSLTSAYIAKSSGSSRVDNAALRHVKSAGPFPKPPKGAKRKFAFVFESKR